MPKPIYLLDIVAKFGLSLIVRAWPTWFYYMVLELTDILLWRIAGKLLPANSISGGDLVLDPGSKFFGCQIDFYRCYIYFSVSSIFFLNSFSNCSSKVLSIDSVSKDFLGCENYYIYEFNAAYLD